MQNNWVNCLFIIEFVNNNVFLASIKITLFFVNKSFHFCISFSLNSTLYISTREQLQTAKIKVITNLIKKILRMMTIKAKVVKNTMIMQVNKHKKKVIYKKDDIIFLSSRNIKTIKSVNKLKDKMLSLFQIKKLVDSFYQLKLSSLMKIYDVFYSSLLWKNVQNLLSSQIQKFSRFIIVDNKKK